MPVFHPTGAVFLKHFPQLRHVHHGLRAALVTGLLALQGLLAGCAVSPVTPDAAASGLIDAARPATAVAAVPTVEQAAAALAEKQSALLSCSQGGCWIVLRHSSTNDDQADTDPLNLDNIAAQRYLSDIGRMEATAIGQALAAVQLPIGTVYTSRFRRAQETAEKAGLVPFTTSIDFTEGGLVVSPNENGRRARALRGLLKTAPPVGNGIVVTHKPNIADALGTEWYGVTPSELTLVRPDAAADAGFKVLARISLKELHGIWRGVQSVASK
jgi:phosphohistidine phosphatase SixA